MLSRACYLVALNTLKSDYSIHYYCDISSAKSKEKIMDKFDSERWEWKLDMRTFSGQGPAVVLLRKISGWLKIWLFPGTSQSF